MKIRLKKFLHKVKSKTKKCFLFSKYEIINSGFWKELKVNKIELNRFDDLLEKNKSEINRTKRICDMFDLTLKNIELANEKLAGEIFNEYVYTWN